MAGGWWEAKPSAELTQGDVIVGLPQGVLVHPVEYLRYTSMKHGADGWATSPDPVLRENLFRMLAAGKVQPAIVVSHSCEIDKGKPRVLVAQIALLNTLEPAQQEKVLAQRAYSHMPLPALPQLGDCYADFRTIGAVHADTVRSAARIATMTPDALVNFQARLVGFLTRLAMPV